jgi:hypothetical protein
MSVCSSVWKFTRFNSRICRRILTKFEASVKVDIKWSPYEADYIILLAVGIVLRTVTAAPHFYVTVNVKVKLS